MNINHTNLPLTDVLSGLGALPGRRLLGEGGSGRTYRIGANGGLYTLKVAYADARQGKSRLRLRRESAVLSRLAVQCVPRLVVAHDNGAFLIREYVAGHPLQAETAARANIVDALLATARELFAVVHTNSYVVRDLKPANLVRCPGGTVSLVDVGSCKLRDAVPVSTPDRKRLGTGKWLFWAPEQLYGGETQATSTIDYYSLGATIAYCILGRSVFSNREPDPTRAIHRYRLEWQATIPELRQRLNERGVSESVADFVVRSLDPQPQARPDRLPEW